MELKEFANLIDGRQYDYRMFTKEELQLAKDNRIVIVTGASDDLVELEGAITDEGDSMDSQSTEERAEKVIIALTPEQLKDICANAAEIGAKEALKTYEQERKKEQGKRADRRLRNTKLLLRNYHMLKEHAENSVFGRTQMEESALDILESMMNLYDNEVIIESIKRSATRTAIIVSHIETMFGLYDAYCEKSPNQDIDRRRYEVVWDKYMAEPVLTVKEIAAKHNMSKENVYSDLRVAEERLTALIFGVDGLKVR